MAKEVEKDPQALAAKIERRIKKRDASAKEIQASLDALYLQVQAFIDEDLKTYQSLSGPDALYHDSPISRAFTYEWIKQYMYKIGLEFVDIICLDGKIAIQEFVTRSDDASKWAMRFTKEQEKKKSGIEAIL